MKRIIEALKNFRSRFFVSVYSYHEAKGHDLELYVFNQLVVQLVFLWFGLVCVLLLLLDWTNVVSAGASDDFVKSIGFSVLIVVTAIFIPILVAST